MLTGRKALVTGATGFIGGRLAERLALCEGANVTALVRDFSRAPRLARLPIEMLAGQVADPEALDQAVRGCDVVFHCAHDWHCTETNLAGARHLAETCLRHAVRRLVYVSSMAVYEPLPDGDVDETSAAEPCGWTYQDNKLAVEHLFLRCRQERGLPVVIVQPTLVYGPYSFPFTLFRVGQLRSGRVVLPDDGGGLCNLVYIDDVVEALLLAAEREEAVGERFLISGAAPVTWREFYAAYERMLHIEGVVLMPSAEIERLQQAANAPSVEMLRHDPRRLLQWGPIRPAYKLLRRALGEALIARVKQSVPMPLHLPDAQALALYKARARVRIDKARRLLGYHPAFDFETGMALTAEYVAWANL
ncbi:MAG TPA: NAD-dependent epimerase/dehydratase family protein [Chthonomonadaceae bacterium]|nr:NAD-dependent epimerase/dehydratase family protein [Chthonomonadaceae bacterium]